jgi:hypothetical protein
VPAWLWIVIAIASAAAVTAIVVAATMVWNSIAKRYAVQLLGKREEARSARRAVEDIVGHLREGSDVKRGEFADDPEALDRHSLAELADRSRVLAEEVNTMPLPARMVAAAEALADAADILAEESGRVGEGTIGDEALDALAAIDLDRVDGAFEHAYALIAGVLDVYHVDDSTAFGGGLYI